MRGVSWCVFCEQKLGRLALFTAENANSSLKIVDNVGVGSIVGWARVICRPRPASGSNGQCQDACVRELSWCYL